MTMPPWVQPVATQMLHGLAATAEVAVVSIIASVMLGLALGMLATFSNTVLRLVITGYMELWRGLPVIVTLFFIFFALPALDVTLPPIVAAELAIVLWGSANLAVLVRGAIQSIPRGQFEAAAAIGFSWPRRMVHIILPQALRRLLPPALGIVVILIQLTTISSLVGVHDFLGVARLSIERLTLTTGNTHAVPILGAVLLVYFAVSNLLNALSRRLERKLQSH
jgi:polar amino acid transport system permease protein